MNSSELDERVCSPVLENTAEEGSSGLRTTRRRGLRWFLALAFTGAWVPWLCVHFTGGSMDDPRMQLVTAAFVPAVAACVVRRWVTKQGFANSGIRLNFLASWHLYLVAVTMPWGVLLLAIGAGSLISGSSPDLKLTSSAWAYLAAGPLICIVMSPIFWGEEYGWTSYLRDRLMPGRPIATTLSTGLIWGVWHWPLPWVGYLGGHTTVSDAVLAMLLWLPLSVLLEFLIGWLWSRTKSVWPGAMLHAGSNLVVSQGMAIVLGDTFSSNVTTLLLCAGLIPFVLAVVLSGHLSVRTVPTVRQTS
jgi:hypothetical protein